MKIVSNPKKINFYYKIGLYTSLGSLAFLVGAVILTLTGLNRPDLTAYSFFAMILGLILSQVGVYFANRWVFDDLDPSRICIQTGRSQNLQLCYNFAVRNDPHELSAFFRKRKIHR